jgi:hypothetical protein
MNTTEDEKHVAAGSPVPSGPKTEEKHKDDSLKPADQLDKEAEEQFEAHNMTDHRGYNEEDEEKVPVKKKNIAGERDSEAKKQDS